VSWKRRLQQEEEGQKTTTRDGGESEGVIPVIFFS